MANHFKIKFKDIIIFENANYIIVNKPPHLSTLDDRHDLINLKKLSKEYLETAQVNHRLDKETSGVLVIAKHADAYRHFSILLEERKVEKIYHAIVWGESNFNEILIEAPLEIKNNGKVVISNRGKYAATGVKTLQNFGKNSLISCKPITGKKHQIRVHLSNAGNPIICDELYGGNFLYVSDLKRKYRPKEEQEERPLIDRFALHAKEIAFLDLDGKEIRVKTDYPKDFQRVINQLEKNV